jgi:protease-4
MKIQPDSGIKARYKKPVVVYMAQQAASGGYYISMAADKIYANRNTLTGSIGVVISAYNYSELAKKVGIEELVFKSGPAKDMMNPMRPATDEEKQIMQGLVDESYGFFVDAVVRGRNLQRDQVLQLADGRIYTGPQAQKLGLLDEIGNLDSAVADTPN